MMPLRILILADPYGKPSYAPRLRFLCNYLVEKGYQIVVYTEQFQPHNFPHAYPIYEKPLAYKKTWQWALYSFWSLLTDWRNRTFSQWVQQQVQNQEFDLVFCTTFSTFPLRAAYEIAHHLQLPLCVDIRDLEEQVPGAQYQGHRQWWTKPFSYWYKQVNIRRRNFVLRRVHLITTVSPWHVDFIKAFNPNTHLIYNGFDPAQFYPAPVKADTFQIVYIGKIYAFQSMHLLEQAIQQLQLPKLELVLHTPDHHPIPLDKVGDTLRQSSMAVVLTSPEAKGMMTTKFYEAFGCEKPILCIPSDQGILAQTIQDTHAGLASSDIEEIKSFILDKYNQWLQQGYTHQAVVNKQTFSRLHQAEQFELLFAESIHPCTHPQ